MNASLGTKFWERVRTENYLILFRYIHARTRQIVWFKTLETVTMKRFSNRDVIFRFISKQAAERALDVKKTLEDCNNGTLVDVLQRLIACDTISVFVFS
jgi:hypothetical protein